MLYGAYGYTGKLIAQEAKYRNHYPVLAGRSAEKLIPFAENLNLDYIVLDLNNEKILEKTVEEYDLVFNSAGPFKYTSAPMVEACLKTGTNYVDITVKFLFLNKILNSINKQKKKKLQSYLE